MRLSDRYFYLYVNEYIMLLFSSIFLVYFKIVKVVVLPDVLPSRKCDTLCRLYKQPIPTKEKAL